MVWPDLSQISPLLWLWSEPTSTSKTVQTYRQLGVVKFVYKWKLITCNQNRIVKSWVTFENVIGLPHVSINLLINILSSFPSTRILSMFPKYPIGRWSKFVRLSVSSGNCRLDKVAYDLQLITANKWLITLLSKINLFSSWFFRLHGFQDYGCTSFVYIHLLTQDCSTTADNRGRLWLHLRVSNTKELLFCLDFPLKSRILMKVKGALLTPKPLNPRYKTQVWLLSH